MLFRSQDWWSDALHIAVMKPNICLDISAWQVVFRLYPRDFYFMLRRALDRLGPWRVFFGSDGPWMNLFCPLDRWVRAVAEPDLASCPEISFSQEEREIVLGKAFARLMGLQH